MALVQASLPAPPSWTDAGTADGRALRNLFGTFLTGVTIVSAHDADGRPRGFTANSFTAVSLAPPMVLVCIRKAAGSFAEFATADRFGVSILGDWQRNLSAAFASPSASKFDGVAVDTPPGGPPLIAGSLSTMDCAREGVIDAGDHAMILGRVLRYTTRPGRPLGFYRGGYVAFETGATALERLGGDAIVAGGIVEHRGRVVLMRRAGHASWEIPTVPLRHGEDHRRALPALLARLGLKADVSLLYSVFQEPGDPHTSMIFLAEATEIPTAATLPDGTELCAFAATETPWMLVAGSSSKEVLRRYFVERETARFGIYWDAPDRGGRVAPIGGTPRRWLPQSADAADLPTPTAASTEGE